MPVYEVERVSRCVTTIRVEAANARQARELAKRDEGEALDVSYQARGTGRVYRVDDDT